MQLGGGIYETYGDLMQAGELTCRVEVQKPKRTEGAGGQPKVEWIRYDHRWASVKPESMKERMQRDKPESSGVWKVVMRYDKNIDETMRIVEGSHALNISGVTWDTHKTWMFMTCIREQ